MASTTPGPPESLRATGREIAMSVATVAATGALTAFATPGAFTADDDPFPSSVTAPVEPSTQGSG